ncbi:hypothetical protein [Streptomyces sp. AK02-01A]|uniref:hypothetical protein n=1 Tax=Streptomyces sp. AK02-01A TaxID=3028648 RepID=UPI0029B711F4|nr:hypothetical protein [Streptomyces sp. AK02-01A]MDX3855928.1 hypothetical protein [Streptomyces sp. AK02-01A]
MTDQPAVPPVPKAQLRARASLIDALSTSLDRGKNGLDSVPGLLRQVITEGFWRHFVTVREEEVRHDDFHEFLRTPPLRGLGADENLIRYLISHEPTILEEFEKNLNPDSDPVSNDRDEWFAGTSIPPAVSTEATEANPRKVGRNSRAFDQLRELRPDLAGRLEAGELPSLNAAMIEAGLRDKRVSIPVTKPDEAAVALRKSLSRKDLAQLIQLLTDGTS